MFDLENNITTWTDKFIIENGVVFDANSSVKNVSECLSEDSGIDGAKLDIPYAVIEAFVAVLAVIGNATVITVFLRERKLRKRTNYYIFSLALADFLVGLLGIPFAILVNI